MRTLWNEGWQFAKLSLGSTYEDMKQAEKRPVILPHDWLIAQTEDLYDSGDGWYVKNFDKSEANADCALVDFDGVYMDADVLLNGETLCTHHYGYTPFFVYLTGINLFFPSIIGSIESCGCFGELIHFTPIESFVKSVVLWLLSLVLMINSYREHEPWNITKLIKDRYMYICIAVSMVLPFYSLWFFDGWNHTIYVVGFIVLCIVILLVIIMSLRQSLQTKETHETERVVEIG